MCTVTCVQFEMNTNLDNNIITKFRKATLIVMASRQTLRLIPKINTFQTVFYLQITNFRSNYLKFVSKSSYYLNLDTFDTFLSVFKFCKVLNYSGNVAKILEKKHNCSTGLLKLTLTFVDLSQRSEISLSLTFLMHEK